MLERVFDIGRRDTVIHHNLWIETSAFSPNWVLFVVTAKISALWGEDTLKSMFHVGLFVSPIPGDGRAGVILTISESEGIEERQ